MTRRKLLLCDTLRMLRRGVHAQPQDQVNMVKSHSYPICSSFLIYAFQSVRFQVGCSDVKQQGVEIHGSAAPRKNHGWQKKRKKKKEKKKKRKKKKEE